MKYRVELGDYQGPKWVPELSFEHDHRINAVDYIRWIATELHRDRERILAETEGEVDWPKHPEYQRWQVRQGDTVIHYITTAHPESWVPEYDHD